MDKVVDGYVPIKGIPQIGEEEFKKLIPYIVNANPETVRKAWLPVVGNMRMRAEVVDKNGKVLFWVPPIERGFDFNAVDNFHGVIVESERHRDISASRADEILAAAFVRGTDGRVHTPEDHLGQWKIILHHYGMLKSDVAPPASSSVKEVSCIDFDDEEDW